MMATPKLNVFMLTLSMIRLADQLHPLHISVSQGNQAAAPPSPESSKELGMNSRNSPAPCSATNTSSTSIGGKWSCLVCTYENFPRAGACVLCGARKGRSSPEHLQGVQAEAAARDSPSPEVNTQEISRNLKLNLLFSRVLR